MNINSHSEKMPFGKQYVKWGDESAELMREGFNMYHKMINTWLNAGQEPSEDKFATATEVWSKWFTDFYKIMFNAIPGPLYMLNDAEMKGANSREGLFGNWKPFFSASPSDPESLYRGIDDFIDYSRSWKKNYIKLYDAWIRCLENVSAAYRSGGDSELQVEKAMKACMESSEGFMDIWRQFALDQTIAFNNFSNSLRQHKDAREIRKKPVKKMKKGKSA